MKADFEYEVVTDGETWRVRWRTRGRSLYLFRWPWLWLRHEVNCGFAGTDYVVTDFPTLEEARAVMRAAIADNWRHNAREARGWQTVESAISVGAVDPHVGGSSE